MVENRANKTSVGVHSIDSLTSEQHNYDKKAVMSMDGLLRPAGSPASVGFPGIASDGDGVTTRAALPPMETADGSSLYDLTHSSSYLNPYSNPTGSSLPFDDLDNYVESDYSGHDMAIVGQGSSYENNPYSYADEYRFLALRGPLVVTGWGYDTEGKPVPNNGTNTDKFIPNVLQKPQDWITAPVDLRYDATRKVWTSPPAYAHVTGEITGIDNDNHYIQTNGTFYDATGGVVTEATITASGLLGRSYVTGDLVITEYNTREEVYQIINPSQRTQRIRFTVNADGSASTIPIKTGTIVKIAPENSVLESSPTSVNNLLDWTYTSGGTGMAEWNYTNSEWDAYQMSCTGV